MTWYRVDDGFSTHAKVDALAGDQPHAVACWTLLGSASMRDLTDGIVTRAALRRTLALWSERDRTRAVEALVRVGLWLVDTSPEAGPGGGWRFHDWHLYQPSRAEVEAQREKQRERQRRHRAAMSSRDASTGDASRDGAVTRDNRSDNTVSHTTPTRPDPTRPLESLTRAPERDVVDPEPLPGHSVPWKPLVEPLRAAILAWAKGRKVAPPREALLGAEGLVLVPVAKWLAETGDAQGWDAAERERRCAWLIERFYAAKGPTADAGYPLAFLGRNPQQYALDTSPRRGGS